MSNMHVTQAIPKISRKLSAALHKEMKPCKGGGKNDYCSKTTHAVHGWCAGCVRNRQWLRSGFERKKAKYDKPTFETLDEVIDFYRKLPQ